jgi:hypothetical protein
MSEEQKRKLAKILAKAKATNLDSHETRLFIEYLRERMTNATPKRD